MVKAHEEQMRKYMAPGGFKIPEHMIEGLMNYVNKGYPIGDFLYAVLTNNFTEAVFRADEKNRKNLPVYAYWIYNHAPAGCWGSEEKVLRWIDDNGLE